jgi:hypothetical protein
MIADYMAILHAQSRTTFAADYQALQRKLSADGVGLSGGSIRLYGELYLASVKTFVDASLSFVRLKSQTLAIDRNAVSTLFSTYAAQDATYAGTFLLGFGSNVSTFAAGIQNQVNAAYALAILQLP